MRSAVLVAVFAGLFVVSCSRSKSESRSQGEGGGSAQRGSSAERESPAMPCLADELGELTNEYDQDHPCRDKRSCRTACETDNDALACLAHAWALQSVKKYDEADEAFVRGCKLGSALACTNHGAAMWLGDPPGVAGCARRLFQAACAADETMGCAMVGRMMAEAAKTPAEKAEARAYFERACDQHGGGACRMFAVHLEQGDLGAFEPTAIKLLMLRACETGDAEACGHESAVETLNP